MQDNSNILDQLYELLEESKARTAKIEGVIQALKELNLTSSGQFNLFRATQSPAPITSVAPSTSQDTRKGTLRELIPTVIEMAGKFIQRAEVVEGLQKNFGHNGKSDTVSVYLGNLTKEGILCRIKFGESNNTFHYGLRSFIDTSTGLPRFASESVMPSGLQSGKFKMEDIVWDL